MTKRHVTFIRLLYRNVLDDIADEKPDLRKELDRDYLRLCSALENHGLRFLTIDMVDFGKHFDKCLSKRRLTHFEGTHMRPFKKGVVIPRLFRGLLLRVFSSTGVMHVTCDHTAVRYLRQLFYLAKKLKLECENVRTVETVRKFYQVDQRVASPSLDWDDVGFDHSALHSLSLLDGYQSSDLDLFTSSSSEDNPRIPKQLLRCIQEVCDVGAAVLGHFDPYAWTCKHGPGAVSERVGISKYDFPSWPEQLEREFPLADFAFANQALWADSLLSKEDAGRFASCESPSKLIAVPKTQKGPRLIASEPVCNQWNQQLIKNFLSDRISRTFYGQIIHLTDQNHNKAAAYQASIDGRRMTIDLSEASDRVSCWVVERMFRRNPKLLSSFQAVRTRFISNDIDRRSPKLYKLKKFSTMGSALTFPVQSLIFSNVVLGCLLYLQKQPCSIRVLKRLARQVLVFGDDIIAPTDAGYLILGALRHLGFEVNRSKTFWTGKFRESCGGDYFDGHDVTPTYALAYPVKQRPESVVSCIATRNNFFRNGYARSAQYLKSTIEAERRLSLPSLPSDFGLLSWETFGESDLSGLRCRFNKYTHRLEVRSWALCSTIRTLPERGTSHLLQYFTEAPPPSVSWKGGVRGRPKLNLRLRWVPLARIL
ncbi:MAG: putative replicase protein [Alehxovirus allofundivivens]|uniref:RNA-directed RNA polymerase n=1 Tax=Leviviridae sp. TaxID=2027243 RepID=A0ABY3SU04_9VIRU|nr:MAG: putative replicase protein [Leviviridae sp.]